MIHLLHKCQAVGQAGRLNWCNMHLTAMSTCPGSYHVHLTAQWCEFGKRDFTSTCTATCTLMGGEGAGGIGAACVSTCGSSEPHVSSVVRRTSPCDEPGDCFRVAARPI